MHVSRIPLCALRCGNPRRIPTQYQTKSPILNKIPKRTLFWKGGSRQEPELVGADKHTVERFTPSDPRRKQRLSAPAPPLTHSFPGVPEASLNVSSQAPKTRITQLSNGVRVASEENYSQMSVVGLFVNTGTRFEDAKLYGSSLMLERMSFKTSKKTPMSEIVSELESMGSHVTTSSSREVLVYSAEILRHHVERSMELIAETTQQPKFLPEELEDQRKAYSFDFEDNSTNPDMFMPELLHEVAYQGHSMGQSLLVPPEQLEALDSDGLREYVSNRFSGSNLVICGAGVDHDHLVKLADTHFGSVPAVAPNHTPIIGMDRPKYMGGEIRVEIPSDKEEKHDKSYIMVGFEAGGFDDPDFYILYTLNSMMGGGSSFSSGGPGKGMYTRLYTRVLNRYGWVDAAETYVTSYKDSGLFGMYARSDPSKIVDLLSVMCRELVEVSRKVSSEELNRAKNQLKTSIFMNLEQRGILFDDIGRQVLLYNKRYTAQELCDLIDSVTMEDLARVTKRLLSSPPSIVYYATPDNLNKLPEYQQVCNIFKQ